MPITPKQIQLLQIARRQAELDEAQYRLMLRNVAGVDSSKDLTQVGFEDCLAVLEDEGFVDTHHGDGYWRRLAETRQTRCTSRAAWHITQLAAQPGADRYDLAALCDKITHGRTQEPKFLEPREAYELTEMLKGMIKREGKAAIADADAVRSRDNVAKQIRLLVVMLDGDELKLAKRCGAYAGAVRSVYRPEQLNTEDAQHLLSILVDQVGVDRARAVGIHAAPFQPRPRKHVERPTPIDTTATYRPDLVPPMTQEELEDVPF